MNKQQNKDVQHKKYSDLMAQIETLAKRKHELEQEYAQTVKAVDTHSQAISKALLAGADSSKEQESRQREKGKAETLKDAISMAELQLSSLAAEKTITEKNLALANVYLVSDELEKQLLLSLKKFNDAISDFQKVEVLDKELRSGAVNVDEYDDMRQTSQIYNAMKYTLFDGECLTKRLKDIESGFANHLRDIRAKL